MNCKTCRYFREREGWDIPGICTQQEAHGPVIDIFHPLCKTLEYSERDQLMEDVIAALVALTQDRSIHDPVHTTVRGIMLRYWGKRNWKPEDLP